MAKLYFYYSAMNAGKVRRSCSQTIIIKSGAWVPLFCPKLDDRSGRVQISSRIGLSAKANTFDNDSDLFVDTRDALRNHKIDCVLVDEAQFLNPKQVLQLTLICDRLNIPVLCYGLAPTLEASLFQGACICSHGLKSSSRLRRFVTQVKKRR